MSQKGSWRTGYVVVLVLFVALLVAYLDRVNVSVLIADKQFLQDMKITGRPDLSGLIMSVFMWTYAVASFALSFLLDRLGARRALILIALLWAVSMFVGGAAWCYAMILVSRIILGIAEGPQLPLNTMIVKNWAPPRERGLANSIWGAGMGVASAIAMPIVAAIVGSLGWRWSFFILGIVSIVAVIPLVLLYVYNRPQDSPRISKEELEYIESGLAIERAAQKQEMQASGVAAQSELRSTLRSANYWLLVAGYTFQTCMFWGLLSWLPSYLRVERGFSWTQMGLLAALPHAVGVVMMIVSGILMLRARRGSLFLWTGCLVSAMGMILAIVSKNNLASALWMILAQAGLSFATPAAFMVLQKIVPAAAMARASGLYQAIASVASGTAPYVVGALIALTGSFVAGFSFLVVLCLLAVVMYLILFQREGRVFGKASTTLSA